MKFRHQAAEQQLEFMVLFLAWHSWRSVMSLWGVVAGAVSAACLLYY